MSNNANDSHLSFLACVENKTCFIGVIKAVVMTIGCSLMPIFNSSEEMV